MSDHGLGRNPFVPSAKDWKPARLAALIEEGAAVPVAWSDPVVLDQGTTPRCVGFCGAGWKATAEAAVNVDLTIQNTEGDRLYAACKVIDNDNQDGSTSRSLSQVLQNEKTIDHYAFGGFDDAKAWVAKYGPVCIGIMWFEEMFTPDPMGVLHPTGSIAGGHEILWVGTNEPRGNILHNSWGLGWPKNPITTTMKGKAYISDTDLRYLIDVQQGDALFMVKLVTPPPTPTPTPTPNPTPPTPVPPFKRVLKMKTPHMTGADVRQLQTQLKKLGYYLGTWGPKKDGIDGNFGKDTFVAVGSFQKDAGLVITGACDLKTWTYLWAA